MASVTAFNDMLSNFLWNCTRLFQRKRESRSLWRPSICSRQRIRESVSKHTWRVYLSMPPRSPREMKRSSPKTSRPLNIFKIWTLQSIGLTRCQRGRRMLSGNICKLSTCLVRRSRLSHKKPCRSSKVSPKDCADKIQSGDGQIDEKALMSMFSSMLKK